MEKIVWSPAFSVGVSEMDKQHQRIIGLINQLVESTSATVRSEVVSDVLTKLTTYASEHFLAEESLLEAHDYPGLSEQKEDHRLYRLKVVALCQDTMIHEEGVPAVLLQFLHAWWIEHILQSDMKYRPFFWDLHIE